MLVRTNWLVGGGVTDGLASDYRSGNGQVSRATVLFVDVRGYTGIAETMVLGRLALWLGEYLRDMTSVVPRHGGTVEHLFGDGLMAIFAGDPRATLAGCRRLRPGHG